jgi:hypothetical protein
MMANEKLTSEAAKTMSEAGASKGGTARANSLTKEERSQIARDAVRKRWMKAGKLKQVNESETPETLEIHGELLGPEPLPYSMLPGKLTFGTVELECHVLNNHMRVITQREVVRVLSDGRESGNLQRYLSRNPLTADDFDLGPTIQFTVPGSPGLIANGFAATTLIEICEKYLEARAQGLLAKSQLKLATNSETVIRACAKVGIIALIDEATGFQKIRADRDLQLKLQAFIAEDLQEWARMFPEAFWLELARLEGIRYSPRSRPLRWGKYVMMFVYDAIDRDIGKELRKKNPNPRFLKNHHQWLKKFGRDQVHDQITKVVTIMQLCEGMEEFRKKFAKIFKRNDGQLSFDFTF